RKLVVVRERHNLLAPAGQERVRADQQSAGPLSSQNHKSGVYLALVGHLEHLDFLTQSVRSRLHLPQIALGFSTGRIVQQGDRRGGWNELVQNPPPLRPDLRGQRAYPGSVASRLIKAGNQPDRHWVFAREDYRDAGGCRLSG